MGDIKSTKGAIRKDGPVDLKLKYFEKLVRRLKPKNDEVIFPVQDLKIQHGSAEFLSLESLNYPQA